MARKTTLNKRQREIRVLMVQNYGILDRYALAEQYGVTYDTIWKDLKWISRIRPVVYQEDHELEAMIRQARGRFDDTRERIFDALASVELRINECIGGKFATGLISQKVALLRELRQLDVQEVDFLVRIGLIPEAVKKIDVGGTLAGLVGDKLTAEIARLEALVAGDGEA